MPDRASAHDNRSHVLSLINSKSQQTVFNVAKVLVCAVNLKNVDDGSALLIVRYLISRESSVCKPTKYVTYCEQHTRSEKGYVSANLKMDEIV